MAGQVLREARVPTVGVPGLVRRAGGGNKQGEVAELEVVVVGAARSDQARQQGFQGFRDGAKGGVQPVGVPGLPISPVVSARSVQVQQAQLVPPRGSHDDLSETVGNSLLQGILCRGLILRVVGVFLLLLLLAFWGLNVAVCGDRNVAALVEIPEAFRKVGVGKALKGQRCLGVEKLSQQNESIVCKGLGNDRFLLFHRRGFR
mmetsp:Transcript_28613/g.77485  ORF Transcript_28613/g.77485 Transcript_28613/m.77485 type:complete len:203 (+) Transcript_28613:779-1387(+)